MDLKLRKQQHKENERLISSDDLTQLMKLISKDKHKYLMLRARR